MADQLPRQDPQIDQTVIYSKFVVAYHLHDGGPSPGWRKANIEGPVYVVRRHGTPRYQLIVKNHENGNDLVDDLHPVWELDCQSKYIFYKVEDPTKYIRGLWFHDDAERIRVEQQLERLLKELRSAPPPRQEPPSPAPQVQAPHVVAAPQPGPPAATMAPPAPAPTRPAPALPASSAAPASVTVKLPTLKAALHSLADDEAFLRAIMDKLKATA